MSGSLPEMEEWDAVFDETYFRFYARLRSVERASDRSPVQLQEARRRTGSAEWPQLVRADYRELRRVLRPGARLVLETMHPDRLARVYAPRVWEPLPDGSDFRQERIFDPVERRFVHRVYTAGEWDGMLAEAGFADRLYFGGWDEEPLTPETRLIAVVS